MKEGAKDKKNWHHSGQDVKFGRCVVSRERASVVGAISQRFAKASFWGIPCSKNCEDSSSEVPCTWGIIIRNIPYSKQYLCHIWVYPLVS